MIKEVIATGATIDEAIAAAKAELRAPEDADVSVEVLELPQKKTFGLFGGSKAKVKASYEAPDEKPKATQAPITEKRPERTMRAEPEKKAPPKPKPQESASAKPRQEKVEPEKKAPEKEPVVYKDVTLSEIPAVIDYLQAMLSGLGLEKVSITAKSADGELFLHVDCEDDYGILIGRRGETLDSVQYLVRLFANRSNQEYTRISINVGNYREKRENNLRQLAAKTASQVLRYGRQSSLEPMNPYERRLIHTAIQEIKGVTSYSVGADAERRVVIALQEGFTPTHAKGGGGRGGNNRNNNNYNRNKNSNGNNNNRGNYNKSNNHQGNRNDQRTTAKDAAAVSLYGKIEPKK
ncbi:MAG: Jag N-terminal domain-containing protein [Oscillospiraceae bacterium]|jgi:spoIIIJ-associated protein|nr:Jag N-terminal domain-containing protein [Oscillospiraceae bacterium]